MSPEEFERRGVLGHLAQAIDEAIPEGKTGFDAAAAVAAWLDGAGFKIVQRGLRASEGSADEYGWFRPETAPRDGSWVLLDIDDGANDFLDGITWSVHVGRWNPKNFPDLGTHFYEWETVARNPHETNPPEIFSNWSDGRIMGWRPIAPPECPDCGQIPAGCSHPTCPTLALTTGKNDD